MSSSIPTHRSLSTFPRTINPSPSELSSKKLSTSTLRDAVQTLHEDGLVVISNLIPHSDIDHLNGKMVKDAGILQSRGSDMPFNYNPSNIQQDPPPIGEYFHPSIFLNPIAAQVSDAFLGGRPKWTFCSGNTALPSSNPQRQPVHSDADFEHPKDPFAVVVNVPLTNFRPENGSTELWLGTHTGSLSGLQVQEGAHGERASGRIKEELLERRRVERGPMQPEIEKGSIVLRDLRLWHAGRENWTDEVRVMIAMIHFAPWYNNPMKLELSESVKPVVENQDLLEVPVDWVSEEAAESRYLNRGFGNSYDFGQVER